MFSKKNYNKIEILIFILTITVQMIFLFVYLNFAGENKIMINDSVEYYNLGINLIKYKSFTLTPEIGLLESLRTPAYPFFISLLLLLSSNILIIPISQIILSGFIIVLFYRIAGFVMPAKYSLICCLFLVFSPAMWFMSVQVMGEVFYILFLLLSVYSLFLYFRSYRKQHILLFLFLIAFSTLIKPSSYYLFILGSVIFVFYSLIKFKDIKLFLIIISCIIFSYSLFILPWSYRNYNEFGKYTLSSVQNYNFYYYNARLLRASIGGVDKGEVNKAMQDQAKKDMREQYELRNLSYEEYRRTLWASDYLYNNSFPYIKDNILEYSYIHLLGLIPFFTDSAWREVLDTMNIRLGQPAHLTMLLSQGDLGAIWQNVTQNMLYFFVFILGKFYYFFLTIFATLSIFKVSKKDLKYILTFFIFVGYFALISGPVSNARYRYPVEGFVVTLAVYLFYKIKNKKEQKGQ